MAIFQNEAIRSLPEQVQKNKEDIKNINDILENIDPDQVATILSDIASIKAEQVVQNTAIGGNYTAINNEKTERESVVGVNVAGNTYLKTATPNKQILINNDGIISMTSSTFVEALANNFVRIATDNASVKADENNGVIIEVDGDNPKTITLKPNGEFEVSNGHILKFDTSGSITIDGQPIGGGGGSQLYRHCIYLRQENSTYKYQRVYFEIITTRSTPFTKETLLSYVNSHSGAIVQASGYSTDMTGGNADNLLLAVEFRPEGFFLNYKKLNFSSANLYFTFNDTTQYSLAAFNNSSTTLNDVVVTL